MTLSMSLRRCLATLGFCTLVVLPAAAFADEDAGSAPSEDATATVTDAGSADVGPTDAGPADAGPADVGPAQDSTSTSEPFSPVVCWDGACPAEVQACKADADCAAIVKCIIAKDTACLDKLKSSKSVPLYNALAKCGQIVCAGSCKNSTCAKDEKGKLPNGAEANCYCDDACLNQKTPDCCADKVDVCAPVQPKLEGSCKDVDCSEAEVKGLMPDGSDGTCYCDEGPDGCVKYGDCCTDLEAMCSASPGTADAGTGGKDAGGSCTCANKECGDDGCGHPCGANKGGCAAGASCGATGKCVTGVADAGGTGADGSAAKDGTTGTVPVAVATKSSGCTAASTGTTGLGLLLALGALIGAVVMRRRFA